MTIADEQLLSEELQKLKDDIRNLQLGEKQFMIVCSFFFLSYLLKVLKTPVSNNDHNLQTLLGVHIPAARRGLFHTLFRM